MDLLWADFQRVQKKVCLHWTKKREAVVVAFVKYQQRKLKNIKITMRQALFTIVSLFALSLNAAAFGSFTPNTAAELGKCGIYADSYQGRPTASGEKYNKDALTCSHKSLAFGTKIRVTRLDNKKSVVVRVNDRGPFIEGYIVDLSSLAAGEIGLSSGSTRVKLEIVESAQSALNNDAQTEAEFKPTLASDIAAKPATYSKTTSVNATPKGIANTSPTTAPTLSSNTKVTPTSNLYKVDIAQYEKKGYGIQITSLTDANNVLPFMKELQAKYPGKVLVNVMRDELNNPTYKVIVGPYPEKKSAETAQKVIAKKYKKTMIVDLSGI